MKAWKPRAGHSIGSVVPHETSPEERRPARCKAMCAELSYYLDEQLDDFLCEELERHLEGMRAVEGVSGKSRSND